MADILIVEDSPATANSEAFQLWNGGHTVRIAASGEEALRLMRESGPDLVLLDYELPDISGMALLQRIIQDFPDSPVVMVTGKGSESLAVEVMKSGGREYLAKTGSFLDSLNHVVNKTLREESARRDAEAKAAMWRHMEETHHELLNASHEAALLVDKEGVVLAVNQMAGDLFGLGLGCEIDDGLWGRLSAEPAGEEQRNPWRQVVEHKKPVFFESQFDNRRLDNTLWPLADGENGEMKVAFFSRDITPQWEARELLMRDRNTLEARVAERTSELEEANLRLQEEMRRRQWEMERAQNYLDMAGSMMVALDGEGLVTLINQKGCQVLGEKEEEILGKNWFTSFIPVAQRQPSLLAFQKRLAGDGGGRAGEEGVVVQRDGEERTILWQNVLIRDEAGQGVGELRAGMDVTGQRRTEQENRLLAAAVEQTVESILITDEAGTVQYANDAYLASTGLSRALVLGRPAFFVQEEILEEEVRAKLSQTLQAGQVWRGPLTLSVPSGQTLQWEVAISPLLESKLKTAHYIVVCRDVTEQKKLEAQMLRSQRLEALGTLAGGISHDFNNLLTPILGFTELMMAEIPPEEDHYNYIAAMRRAAERARDLVNQILLFSRQKEGRMAPLHSAALVKEVVKLMGATLPSTILIKTEIAPDAGKILGDPTQIQTLLMNLFVNASHAMGSGGELSVSLANVGLNNHPVEGKSVSGQFVRLMVADTGEGMSEAVISRIFEPFFTTKEVGKGTGLGLSTVYGVVKQHQGFIEVESQPGKGSRFKVYFPMVTGVAVEEQPEDLLAFPTGYSARILLVDDDEEVVRVGVKLLERQGYQVRATTRSQEALLWFQNQPQDFDLIITDQMMPYLSGDQLAAEIRKMDMQIPILMFTGYPGNVTPERLKELSIGQLLAKPFSGIDLGRAVEGQLRDRPAAGKTPAVPSAVAWPIRAKNSAEEDKAVDKAPLDGENIGIDTTAG